MKVRDLDSRLSRVSRRDSHFEVHQNAIAPAPETRRAQQRDLHYAPERVSFVSLCSSAASLDEDVCESGGRGPPLEGDAA